ncbi:PhoH family protein [Nostoc sp. CHAB 5834]|nr:PhoH family protein [Nostoc sp. CHAB 5834]
MPARKRTLTKLFVLDTNVLLHDPFCLVKFGENDVYLPFVTIEELDNKKVGHLDINRNARQATRLMQKIMEQPDIAIKDGFELSTMEEGRATGKLLFQSEEFEALAGDASGKNDNRYLTVLKHLKQKYPKRPVVLVTKDLNLSIKAKMLGFAAEDYKHDQAVEDADLIFPGYRMISPETVEAWKETCQSWKEGWHTFFRIPNEKHYVNEMLMTTEDAVFRVVEVQGEQTVVRDVSDTRKAKHGVLGVTARNQWQRAAVELLLDPEVDMVALLGVAGTGKTLLALASALSQVHINTYDSILFTRANVAMGDEIGHLPGTEEEKMNPWLGALFDNLDVICSLAPDEAKAQKLRELSDKNVEVKAITFMRGRSFQNRVIILDEAQNLTPKQIKALVTRAGDGTKVVLMGNLAQIDTPYLSETSSGLAYAVERFKGWKHFGSLVMQKGERSRLADAANERL